MPGDCNASVCTLFILIVCPEDGDDEFSETSANYKEINEEEIILVDPY
jgi:hypothetical protein